MNLKLFIGFIIMVAASSSVLSHPTLLVETTREFDSIPCNRKSVESYLQTAGQTPNAGYWIVVKHGQSLGIGNEVKAGRLPKYDVDLSEKGRRQVIALARDLKKINLPIHQAFSSPSKCAFQTLECLKEELASGMEISTTQAITERWFGPFEGATEQEYAFIKEREEKEIPLFKTFAEKFAFKANPEMESLEEVNRRARDFILDHHVVDKMNLVVTHNAVMKALFMAAIAQQGYDIEYHDFDLENCSVLVLKVTDSREISIEAVAGLKFRPRYSSFFAMRHEKTKQNEEHNWNIPNDSPLSEMGLQGSRKLAETTLAKRITFDRAVTSNTTRAMQTMDSVLQESNSEIVITQDSRLSEIKMSYDDYAQKGEFVGEAEFLSYGKKAITEQIQGAGSDTNEDLQRLWQIVQEDKLTSNDLFRYNLDGAETFVVYSQRFLEAFSSHLTPGERTAFCVHSTGIKAILSQLRPESETFDSIRKAKAPPGSWIHGRVYLDGTMLLIDSSSGITIPSSN